MNDQGRDVWLEKVERALESLRGEPDSTTRRKTQTASPASRERQTGEEGRG